MSRKTWLVNFKPGIDKNTAEGVLTPHGARTITGPAATPMAEGDWVAEVDGPEDLPARLKNDQRVQGVYPSSPMTYYGSES